MSFIKTCFQFIGVETNQTSHLERLISGLATCFAISVVALVTKWSLSSPVHVLFFASAAASAFLVFALPHGALSQPWPTLAGQTIAALVGVGFAEYLDSTILTAALSVGCTVFLMHYLGCLHPPGGATAFYFVTEYPQINAYESVTVFLINICVIILLAMVVNNLFYWRRYPLYWLKKTTVNPSLPHHFEVEDLHHVLQQQDVFVDVSLSELQSIYEAASQVASDKRRRL